MLFSVIILFYPVYSVSQTLPNTGVGDDGGRVNEIRPSDGSLVQAITTDIDEPYHMDIDGLGILYVANKDNDDVMKISSGSTTSISSSDNRLDDPRGVELGPVYSSSSSSSRSESTPPSHATGDGDDGDGTNNEEPDFTLTYNGTAVHGPVLLSGQDAAEGADDDTTETTTATLAVQATDPEGDHITIEIMPDVLFPPDAVSTTDHGNGTATILINTANVTSGTYVLWVTVSDQYGGDRQPYAVTVEEEEPSP